MRQQIHTDFDPERHDASHGIQTREPASFSRDEETDHAFKLALATQQELRRISRKLYNWSNPVDEYQSSTGAPAGGRIDVQPDYDIPVRYESVLYSLPVGITSAVLTIGQRAIPLLSVAAATTAQTVNVLPYLGIIAVAEDKRFLTLTGAPTTGFYIGLMGHCLERDGLR